MQAFRLAAPALALAAVLSSVFLALGFATASRTSEDAVRSSPNDHQPVSRMSADRAPRDLPKGGSLSAAMPTEDAAGEPIPGLPRYPGSVRIAYSENRTAGLDVVKARFLTERRPSTVRDFYDEVFRSEGWRVANVEYSGGEWFLLAVHGGREAGVDVSPRGGGSEVGIEVSWPRVQEEEASAGGSKR